mmetsp:Transcript_38798/g.93109  ORF Transcript_38798/g.93109 Transcript_38798/m.93109 type:complete len:263 (+) Transcript_38798:290-1078(+)
MQLAQTVRKGLDEEGGVILQDGAVRRIGLPPSLLYLPGVVALQDTPRLHLMPQIHLLGVVVPAGTLVHRSDPGLHRKDRHDVWWSWAALQKRLARSHRVALALVRLEPQGVVVHDAARVDEVRGRSATCEERPQLVVAHEVDRLLAFAECDLERLVRPANLRHRVVVLRPVRGLAVDVSDGPPLVHPVGPHLLRHLAVYLLHALSESELSRAEDLPCSGAAEGLHFERLHPASRLKDQVLLALGLNPVAGEDQHAQIPGRDG